MAEAIALASLPQETASPSDQDNDQGDNDSGDHSNPQTSTTKAGEKTNRGKLLADATCAGRYSLPDRYEPLE